MTEEETGLHDELTAVDIRKMKEEIEYRTNTLRPKLIEDVQTARSFGDLSENFEYKAAKREKNRNDSRIRYLENMIRTAVVIEDRDTGDRAGLFDRVTLYLADEDETQTVRFVTTLRQNALKGLISKESPLGKAVLGHKVGETVTVQVSEEYSYPVTIRAIEPGEDDPELEISSY